MSGQASQIKGQGFAGNNYHQHHYGYNRYYGSANDGTFSKRNSYAYDDHYGYGDKDEISRHDHYGYSDHGGSLSGYGHHDHKDCCPLVVKPLVLLSILGGIALGAALLNVAITMELGMMKKKRRSLDNGSALVSLEHIQDLIGEGRKI